MVSTIRIFIISYYKKSRSWAAPGLIGLLTQQQHHRPKFILFSLPSSVCWLCPKLGTSDSSEMAIPVFRNTARCNNIPWRWWHISLYVSIQEQENLSQKAFSKPLLRSHWPELGHMPTPNLWRASQEDSIPDTHDRLVWDGNSITFPNRQTSAPASVKKEERGMDDE